MDHFSQNLFCASQPNWCGLLRRATRSILSQTPRLIRSYCIISCERAPHVDLSSTDHCGGLLRTTDRCGRTPRVATAAKCAAPAPMRRRWPWVVAAVAIASAAHETLAQPPICGQALHRAGLPAVVPDHRDREVRHVVFILLPRRASLGCAGPPEADPVLRPRV